MGRVGNVKPGDVLAICDRRAYAILLPQITTLDVAPSSPRHRKRVSISRRRESSPTYSPPDVFGYFVVLRLAPLQLIPQNFRNTISVVAESASSFLRVAHGHPIPRNASALPFARPAQYTDSAGPQAPPPHPPLITTGIRRGH